MVHEYGAIPRDQSWYQQWPFDATLTFRDAAGDHWRYMVTPTDERYLKEPQGHFVQGSLPPEEVEVRDHLLVVAMLRRRVGILGMVRSLLLRWPSTEFIAAQRAMVGLRQLCIQSREHRAALLRLGHAQSIPPVMRQQLLILVGDVDASLRKLRR